MASSASAKSGGWESAGVRTAPWMKGENAAVEMEEGRWCDHNAAIFSRGLASACDPRHGNVYVVVFRPNCWKKSSGVASWISCGIYRFRPTRLRK